MQVHHILFRYEIISVTSWIIVSLQCCTVNLIKMASSFSILMQNRELRHTTTTTESTLPRRLLINDCFLLAQSWRHCIRTLTCLVISRLELPATRWLEEDMCCNTVNVLTCICSYVSRRKTYVMERMIVLMVLMKTCQSVLTVKITSINVIHFTTVSICARSVTVSKTASSDQMSHHVSRSYVVIMSHIQ